MNTAGFNDGTRALLHPGTARHDISRRADYAFLAELVTTHRLDEAGDLAGRAYWLRRASSFPETMFVISSIYLIDA